MKIWDIGIFTRKKDGRFEKNELIGLRKEFTNEEAKEFIKTYNNSGKGTYAKIIKVWNFEEDADENQATQN